LELRCSGDLNQHTAFQKRGGLSLHKEKPPGWRRGQPGKSRGAERTGELPFGLWRASAVSRWVLGISGVVDRGPGQSPRRCWLV